MMAGEELREAQGMVNSNSLISPGKKEKNLRKRKKEKGKKKKRKKKKKREKEKEREKKPARTTTGRSTSLRASKRILKLERCTFPPNNPNFERKRKGEGRRGC